MKEPASSSDTSLAARGMQLLTTSYPFLTDIQGMIACFTTVPIYYNTACTATKDQRCELSMHLATWNQLLLPARLQLRQLSGTRPRLSLVTRGEPRFADPPLDLILKSLKCAYCLLKSHTCIDALDLSLKTLQTREDFLFEALKESSSVKSLKVSRYTARCAEKLIRLVSSMQHLEELEFVGGEGSWQLQTALSELLSSTASLRVLRSPPCDPYGNSVLLRGLFANSTLNELSLSERILSTVDEEYLNEFKTYLEKSVTLTTFYYYSEPGPYSGCTLNGVLDGLLRNKTIRNLRLVNFVFNCETTGLMSKLLETTECLRSFEMISHLENVVTNCCDQEDGHSSWMLALARSNLVEKVELSMDLCSARMWRLFLEALSSNSNTMKVIIEANFVHENIISEVCNVLREGSMEERASIPSMVMVTDLDVLDFKALSFVFVNAGMDSTIAGWPVLDKLPLCRHLTCVDLIIPWQDNKALFTAIAAYVETSVTLKKLWLSIAYHKVPRTTDFKYWEIITTSLIRNTSIREVVIRAEGLDAKVSELLADTVKCRKNTWIVGFCTLQSAPQRAFIQRLSMGIADNFALLKVILWRPIEQDTMGQWFVVDETARRNSGLLTSAAQFATGALHDRCGAQALERVSDHGALPEELKQVASVESREEAAAMIRRSLRSIEGMDKFMKLSGVVRERVVCLPSPDGRPQLDDLDEYCWGAVRRYLLLEDVRHSDRS